MENNKLNELEIARIIANPFYAINIDQSLCEKHEPLIDEKTWIKTAKRLIEEDGIDLFLWNLLENLKGNYPK